MSVRVFNPANSLQLANYSYMNQSEVYDKLKLNQLANQIWQNTSVQDRSKALLNFAKLLEERKHYFATLITVSMGKPITNAIKEVEKCCMAIRYYAEHGPIMLEPKSLASSCQILQPLGTILAVMPWNYPLWQVVRVLAPNFILGNSIALCHSPNVFVVAKALESLVAQSDLPSCLLISLLQEYKYCQQLIASDYIKGLAFTGSDNVGAMLAGYAGSALKPSTVECGGSDPYLVLADADFDLAAETIVAMRMNNSGQVCVSAKRIIVVESAYQSMVDLIYDKMSNIKCGDPMQSSTCFGPLARDDIRQEVHAQVLASVSEGARCVLGGKLPCGSGYYYPPTMLIDVTPEMTVFKQEVFGPVMTLIRANCTQHAIELANEHKYGLGAAVFTQDHSLANKIALSLNAGICAINRGISSDPSLPFGGVGRSGYGRELGVEGVTAFANIKIVFG